MTRHTFFATCAPGLESILHAEAKALRLARLECQVGGVRFEGTLEDAWRANLWLRTAVRVLLRVARFTAGDGDALYAGTRAVDWSTHLVPASTLWIDAQCRDSALTHSRFVAQRVKDALVDQLREVGIERPSIQREGARLRVHVHLSRDRCTLSLDTSGESLHKRGWRRAQGKAPLAETLAAAVVLASGWDGRAPLLDPFCGSGTLLVEAGLIATGTPPGALRGSFGFESWPGHDSQGYQRVKEQALASTVERPKLRLVGSDWDAARVQEARAHLAEVGLGGAADISLADARVLEVKPGWNAWVVSNLPYGERVGSEAGLRELYVAFGRLLVEKCEGYHLALLCGNPRLSEALSLGSLERRPMQNGSIACELLLGRI